MLYTILAPLLAALHTATAAMREELADARRIAAGTAAQLKDKRLLLAQLRNKLRALRARDPRALGLALWEEILLLAAVGTAEFWTNLVCAQGLFLDQTATDFIAGAFTLVTALLAWGLAREDRLRRRAEASGEVGGSRTLLYGLLGILGAYGVGSFILRKDYFAVSNQIAKSLLGSSSMTNAWIVAGILTILSLALIGLAAYVLSHADRDVAAVKHDIKAVEREIETLERSHRSARAREDGALQAIDDEVKQAHFSAMSALDEAERVPAETKAREALSRETHAILWRTATTVGLAEDQPTVPVPNSETEKTASSIVMTELDDLTTKPSPNGRGDEKRVAEALHPEFS